MLSWLVISDLGLVFAVLLSFLGIQGLRALGWGLDGWVDGCHGFANFWWFLVCLSLTKGSFCFLGGEGGGLLKQIQDALDKIPLAPPLERPS